MVKMKPRSVVNRIVSRNSAVRRGIRRETKQVERKAQANLERARATTTHEKIAGPAHLTKIGSEMDGPDGKVWMSGGDPIAIEYGHGPSGYFDPDKYGKVTKAPHGLYILTRAAGIESNAMTPSMGARRGKR